MERRSRDSVDTCAAGGESTPKGGVGPVIEAEKINAGTAVPLLDLEPIHAPIRARLKETVLSILETNRFVGGPELEAFESEIADYCGVECAVGVSSGTDALLISLMAMEIGAGDEVIVPSFTFFSSAGSVHRVGARIVFCDIDPVTYNLDHEQLETLITPRTKAVMPVHLFGQCAEMGPILEICRNHGLKIIEDAAQAIGAQYDGCMAGSMGDVGCFSFYPSKNLSAMGDAGMVTTNNGELAERIRFLRNHGEVSRYHHAYVGGNFRLDAIQAAVLRVKLSVLEDWHQQRRDNASQYRAALSDLEESGLIGLPSEIPGRRHVFNQFVIRVGKRDALQQHLSAKNIGTAIYYPVPLHLQPCFSYLGYQADSLKVTEAAAREVLAIPVFPGLTVEQKAKVIRCVRAFFNG